tara:strand:- start:569 stop:922 length:354 start_codon:yes stop_codon:yes gene_type:complete
VGIRFGTQQIDGYTAFCGNFYVSQGFVQKNSRLLLKNSIKESRMVVDFEVWCKAEQALMTGIKFNESEWLKDLDIIRELWHTEDTKLFHKETKRLISKHDRDWELQGLKTEKRLKGN